MGDKVDDEVDDKVGDEVAPVLHTVHAFDFGQNGLGQIHLLQSMSSGFEAMDTRGKLFELPRISKHPALALFQNEFLCLLEQTNRRTNEISSLIKFFQSAIAQSSWNERNNASATLKRKRGRL